MVPVVHRYPSAGWLLLKTLEKKERMVHWRQRGCRVPERQEGGGREGGGGGEKMSFWSKPPLALLVVDLVDSGLLVPGAGHNILIVY